MKAEDYRGKTVDELTESLNEYAKEAFNLRFQRSTGQRVGLVRRDIARIKTILNEKGWGKASKGV